mgnify:CR=1 FL=1
MKRSEALAPLSRDHHRSLILAQLLKKNAPAYKDLPSTTEGKIRYAVDEFEKDIKVHFEKEEQVLEKIQGYNKEIDLLAAEIRNEHMNLAELFSALNTTTAPQDVMDELGRKLEAHIRKEERSLFPMLEQYCSEETIQQFHALLH